MTKLPPSIALKRGMAFLLLAAYPAICSAMQTSEFVVRWKAASANHGRLPPDQLAQQPEFKVLTAELSKAFDAYKAEIVKARTDGTMPSSCPPQTSNLQVNDIVAAAEKLPHQWQSREFTDSLREIMAERYPCAKGSSSG